MVKGTKFLVSIVCLHLYGLVSTLFNAWTTGQTADEWAYIRFGSEFLSNRDPSVFVDHPPFAWWWGALIPHFTGDHSLFAFRIAQVLLFSAAGAFVTSRLWVYATPWAALFFAALFNLDPAIKAMASLDVTDPAFMSWMAIAGISFWVYLQKKSVSPLLLGSLAYGLAMGTKVSALFYFPFLLLIVGLGGSGTSKAKWKSYFFRYFLAGFFVLTGLTAAYLFNFQKVGYFIDSFHFSMSHNRNGHMTSMFGQFSETGFWYFYIVLFLFKTPIPTLLCMVMAARSWFRNTDLFWVFIGPTLLLFALLTHANVQLGYRYFLPGWALLYTATSIAVGKVFTEGKLPFDRKWLIPIAGAFVGSLLAVDLCALIGSSYFPYFNALTPRPSRNFVDANIDWRQGIPRHLLGRVENSLSAADLPNFIRDPKLERARFLVGPSELAGFWGSSFGPQLRAFEPESIVAGFELTSVSRNDLYLLLRHKKPRNTDWTRNGLHDVSVPLSDFRALERHCPTGSRLRTFSRELPVSSESASEEQLHPGSEVVILVQSNLPPEVRVNGELVIPRAISGHAGLVQVQWVSFVPKAKMNQFQIRFSATPASSSAFLLWQECDQSAL